MFALRALAAAAHGFSFLAQTGVDDSGIRRFAAGTVHGDTVADSDAWENAKIGRICYWLLVIWYLVLDVFVSPARAMRPPRADAEMCYLLCDFA